MMEKDGQNMNLFDISIPQGRFAFQSSLAQMSISKGWTRMLNMLFLDQTFGTISIFCQKSKFLSKNLEILVKNRNSVKKNCKKSKFL